MDLETLEVKFNVDTSGLRESMEQVNSIFNSVKQYSDLSENFNRMEAQLNKLNENFKSSFNTMAEAARNGASQVRDSASNIFSEPKQQMNRDLDAMVSEINAKMSQAKAAMEKIRSMVNQKNSLSNAQQSGIQGTKFDSQIASAQSQMIRYQNQAKALAQQLQREYDSVPDSLHRIAKAMDQNEVKIETLRVQLKRLQEAYSDVTAASKVSGGNSKLQSKMTSLEKSIMSTREKMNKLISSNDKLGQSYSYVQDRVKPLKTALNQIDTSLEETNKLATSASSSFEHMGSFMGGLSAKMDMLASASKKSVQYLGGFMKSVGPIRNISNAVKKATSSMNMFGRESESSMSKASRSGRECYGVLSSIRQQLMFLPSMLIVYGLLWNGISSLATSTAQAFEVNKKFAASLETIKDNLLTAFYPIYSYVLPAVNALMSSLEKATSWLAQFTSALTGMSFGAAKSGAKNLKEQVSALNDTSSSSSAASKAIKKANEQIREENRQNSLAVKHQNEEIEESNRKARAEVQKENAQIAASNKAATESYEKQKKAAEELTESLMGFDELNILDKNQSNDISKPESQSKESYTSQPTVSSPDSIPTESTDSDDAEDDTPFTPSSSVFDSAANAANRLKKILGELFDPMKEAWADKGQEVMDAAKYAAKELGKDFEDVGRSFMSVWTNGTGKETMENLLQLVADLLNIIGDIGKAFDEAWNHGNAGTKLIQTIFDSLNSVLHVIHDVASSFRTAFNDNNLGEQIFSDLIKLGTDLFKIIKDVADSFDKAWKHGDNGTELFKILLKAADDLIKVYDTYATQFDKAWKHGNQGIKMFDSIFNAAKNVVKVYDDLVVANQKAFSSDLGERYWNDILTIITGVYNTVGNLAGQFDKAWNHANIGVSIYKDIYRIEDNILDALAGMATYTANWAAKLNFTPLLESIHGLLKAIAPLTKTVFDGLAWGYENILLPLAKFTITELLPNFLNLLAAALKAVNSIINAAKPAFKWIWDSFLEPLAKWTGGVIIDVLKKLTGLLTDISDWVDKHQKAVETAAKVIIGMFTFKIAADGISKGVGFLGKIADYAVILGGKENVLKNFFGNITGISSLKDAWTNMKNLWKLSKMGWSSFAGKIVEIWEAFKNWSVWSKLAAAGQAILNAAMDLNPYVLLASAIAAIVVALSAWYLSDKKNRDKVVRGWNSFKTTMSKTWDSLKKAVGKWSSDTAETVDDGLTNAQKALKKDGDAFSKEWSSLWTGLTKWLSKNWEGVSLVIVNPVLGGLKLLYDNNPKFSKWVDDLWSDTQKSFKTFEKNWNSYWSGIDDDLQNAWDTASKNTKSAWDNISSKIESASKQARSDAKFAWDNLQNDTSDAWDNISSNTQSLWNTVSSKISSFANNAKDNATSTWDSLKNNTSNVWNDVNSNTQSLWNSISDKVSSFANSSKNNAISSWNDLKNNTSNAWSNIAGNTSNWWGSISSKIGNSAGNAKNNALNAWNDLKNSTSGYFSNIQQTIGSAWNNIISGARSLGDNIASGIRGGMSAVRSAMDDLKDSLISPVKSAVNKIKDGINWVLKKVGAGGLSWGWFNWANGTANHPGGLAMVNDENSADYRESYQLPNGKQGIFPAVRNLVLPLPAGTQIKSAAATQASISKLMPHYAGGIGDFNFDFSGLEDALKALSSIDWSSLGGDIWSGVTDEFDNILDDVTHPKKLLDYMVNKFMSYDWGWTDTQTKLAKGSVNTLEDGLTGWAKNILKKFGSASGGTIPSGNHQNLMKEAGIPSSWFNDMNWLVTTESGWKTNATNPSSGAYGLPQSLPGSKMASAGSDWRTNPVTQLKWMYDYVSGRYGTAANAVRFHKINGWYANGGFVDAEGLYGMAEGNKPEMVLPLTDKNRTLQLIKEAMNYIGENFTSGLQMPTVLTADTGAVNTEPSANNSSSANTTVQSGGISQLSTNLVNAIVQGLQMATGSSTDSNQPININLTVNMDSDQLGQAAIKGINSVNAKNHRNMLNL
ncbi:phage tail protein [Liquorilactobacillus nagelii]|uniref:aggregation-promoting factor C-terminal-like domain-containing protein n=1 Tax=Liquorilactobacillus nagelii TaxID=82688 RepID=UPI0039E84BC4